MGWEETSIGGESYRQDSTMGCAFACIATATYWRESVKKTEESIRSKLTGQGILWEPKQDAMTGGLNIETTIKLLHSLGIKSEAIEGLSEDKFLDKMKEASPECALILGVTWSTGEKHLVVCGGPSSNGSVWIFDPGLGLGENAVSATYDRGLVKGTFDLKGIQVTGSF